MRKIFLLSFIMIVVTAAFSQERKTLEGNGNSVTREVTISSFDALKAKGVFELRLTQGQKEGVKIEADENLQELFEVKNEGQTLVIAMKENQKMNLKSKNKMVVHVSFRSLKKMDLSTVGNVVSEGNLSFQDVEMKNKSVGDVNLQFSAKKLQIENSSVGNLTLKGNADDATFKNSGVGSLQAGDLKVQTIYIENTGIGNAEVNAEKELKVKDHSLGKVSNKGAAQIRRMNRVRV